MDAKAGKKNHVFKRLNDAVIAAIVKDIAEGAPNKHAVESKGLTESIFYTWIKQGVIDAEQELDTLPARLVKSLRETEMKEIKWCRARIMDAEKGHRGAEWTLERCYWKIYGANAANVEMNERLEKLESDKVQDELK